jgi:hypothetical protein
VKKFFAFALLVVLVLSMASLSLAAELSSIIGGRYYGYFSTIDGDKGFNPAPGVDAWDTILGATVKEENSFGTSWATIKFIADTWNQKIYHSFGIDNIAGSPLSLGFDSHDSGTANLGQQFMGDLFNDFKADPFFNTCDMAGSFNLKYITDTFEFRGEAKVYDSDGDTDNTIDEGVDKDGNPILVPDQYSEAYALGLIFKTDAGKFYVGAKTQQGVDDPFYIVGGDFKLNDVGLKLDLWLNDSGIANQGEFTNAFWAGGGHQTLQATITYDKITGQLMYSKPEADLDDVIGAGIAYQLTSNWTAGAKYFAVDDSVAEDGFYDVYGMFDVGAWDLKVGVSNAQFPFGHCGDKNEGGNYNSKQAFESEDPFFYVGVHFEF